MAFYIGVVSLGWAPGNIKNNSKPLYRDLIINKHNLLDGPSQRLGIVFQNPLIQLGFNSAYTLVITYGNSSRLHNANETPKQKRRKRVWKRHPIRPSNYFHKNPPLYRR